MTKKTEACPLCNVGTASQISTFHVIPHPPGDGIADLLLMECGLCKSEYGGDEEMAFNKAAAVKLKADMQTIAVTGKIPDDMLKCWSCRVIMYTSQRSNNDGYCPSCDCEIVL